MRARRCRAPRPSTVAASPAMSTSPSSSLRTPARKSWWSSTIRTRGPAAVVTARSGAASARPRCRRPAPSGSPRGRRGAPCARRSTRARRAGRRGIAVVSKPGAAVADEDLDRGRRAPRRRRRRSSRRRTSPRSPSPRARRRRAPRALASRSASPTATTSTATPWSRSTSLAAVSSAAASGRRLAVGRGAPDSHARSSRSWRRARAATSRGSSERCCTRASVCSTESCRCAAISARSCERMRSARSVGERAHEPQRSTGRRSRRGRPRRRAPTARRRARR